MQEDSFLFPGMDSTRRDRPLFSDEGDRCTPFPLSPVGQLKKYNIPLRKLPGASTTMKIDQEASPDSFHVQYLP